MIDRDRISEVVRYHDAESEEHDDFLVLWTERQQVDIDGLVHVAKQRALRIAMGLDGQDSRQLSETEPTQVKLSSQAHALMPFFASGWVDGFATGLALGRQDDATDH